MPHPSIIVPIMFCDIDGVIRPRDQVRGTSGEAHDYDPEHHYHASEGIVFEDKDGRPQGWEFHWAPEMITILRGFIKNGLIDFKWTTNWQEWAGIRLNPLFRFPDHISHIPINYDKKDRTQSYKGEAVIRYLEETPDAAGRPFMWVDDIATLPYLPGGDRYEEFEAKFAGVPHLVMATEERHGITVAQMREILHFIMWTAQGKD